MVRTFEEEATWPHGIDWAFLHALYSYIESQLSLPIVYRRAHATLTDGDVDGIDFDDLKVHEKYLAEDSFALIVHLNSKEVSASIYVSNETDHMSFVTFDGENEALVRGLAASVQRRIDRGDFSLAANAEPAAPVSELPAPPASPVAAPSQPTPTPSPPPPQPDPSLMRRAFNHPWVVAIVTGLIVIILVGAAALIVHA